MNRKQLAIRLAPFALLAATGAARAEVDLAPITAAGVSVGLVGVAVFAVVVGIKVFKWIRGAL